MFAILAYILVLDKLYFTRENILHRVTYKISAIKFKRETDNFPLVRNFSI